MKTPFLRTYISSLIFTVSLTLALIARAVDPPPDGGYPNGNTAEGPTIEVITTFDAPGVAATAPEKINDLNQICGIGTSSSGATRGFLRLRNGHFAPPIVAPNDNANSTQAWEINSAGLICGTYQSDDTVHGFFFSRDAGYTEFDVPGGTNTSINGLNDASDFCGTYFDGSAFTAFVTVSGTVTPISVPGATSSGAVGINNAGAVVGSYTDRGGVTHGFFRDGAGTITAPIDVVGATSTSLRDLNDQNIIVGRFFDATGFQRGFVLKLPATVIVFDYTGATRTALNGINNNNLMSGYYRDSSFVIHGVIARLR